MNRGWLLILVVVFIDFVDGRVSTQQAVAFEVASVRPNRAIDGPTTLAVPPKGMVVATNYPLLWLVRYAYGLTSLSQIHGGPDWA